MGDLAWKENQVAGMAMRRRTMVAAGKEVIEACVRLVCIVA